MSTMVVTNPREQIIGMFHEAQICSAKGDISKKVMGILVFAKVTGIISDMWITLDELVELLVKGYNSAERYYRHYNFHSVADRIARQRMEFERRLELYSRSRPLSFYALLVIIPDIITCRFKPLPRN